MDFTFGIITGGYPGSGWRDIIMCIVDSIRRQNIPNYEIIIIGGPFINEGRYSDILHVKSDIKHILFDDTKMINDIPILEIPHIWGNGGKTGGIEPAWITKKKNLITKNAKYENIVFMHDYICLTEGWYQGFLKFGNDWDICMTKIKNIFGERYRDWVSWDCPKYGVRNLIPYEDNSPETVKHTFIIGGYWVAKKYVMEKEPLNENILLGGMVYLPEENKYVPCGKIVDKKQWFDDVEWSLRIREKYKYVMNPYSTVRHIRVKFTGEENFVGRTNCPETIRYI